MQARIFIVTCLPACLPAYFCRRPHIHCDTWAPNANFKNIAEKKNLSTLSPRCLQYTSYRHLHQYQQSFVTLNSPLLFDAAPQTRCIPQITYPELEAEERKAFHKRQQLAEPLTHLFIYLLIYFPFCHHAKPNTDFMFQLACFHLVFGVNSVHMACSSAPSKHCPPCTLKSICLTPLYI
jgi:hypothetical protein